ncbi:MAG: hypothetical protein AMR96_06360 [Candidatus Adiutrix intracellularis]|nr:MAG: hypothetical protein AMR96_06360 [Candidatus Adiutrix intracellularis]
MDSILNPNGSLDQTKGLNKLRYFWHYLKNIFSNDELSEAVTTEDFLIVQTKRSHEVKQLTTLIAKSNSSCDSINFAPVFLIAFRSKFLLVITTG